MDNKLTKEDFIKQYKERTKKSKKEIINDILKNVNPKDYLKVKDNIVLDSNLCIILSCPGEEEMLNQKVCAGETGNNLEKILRIVVNEIKEIKQKIERLEENDDKIGEKFTEQFNEMKTQVSQTRQDIAEMRGALDLLIQKLVK